MSGFRAEPACDGSCAEGPDPDPCDDCLDRHYAGYLKEELAERRYQEWKDAKFL